MTPAMLFFNMYESAEVRFIEKHLDRSTDLPIVELGSSIGVIANQVRKKTQAPIICLEANPALIPVLAQNTKALGNTTIVNAAIANQLGNKLYFKQGATNVSGHLTDEASEDTIEVPATSLQMLLQNHNIDKYILICDIEGAEIFLLKEDAQALQHCKMIIIELHETSYLNQKYSVTDLIGLIENLNFKILNKFGSNLVFIP